MGALVVGNALPLGVAEGSLAPRESLTSRSAAATSIRISTASSVCRPLLGVRASAKSALSCSLAVEGNNIPKPSPRSAPITIHIGETTFTMPFSSQAAKGLNAAIDGLFQTFKEREKASRPQRWKSMEFRQTGEEGVFLEVFCNPNAYSNAFQAKVLITIKDEKIRIASEGQLSALKADIDDYVSQNS